MFWRLRLYLDPFVPFKSLAREADALEYNRRHRALLLPYVRRWAMIALGCAGGLFPLGAAARVEPMLCVPLLGLELGFSSALCVLLLALAVYVVLGLEN